MNIHLNKMEFWMGGVLSLGFVSYWLIMVCMNLFDNYRCLLRSILNALLYCLLCRRIPSVFHLSCLPILCLMGDAAKFYCQREIEPDSPSWYESHGVRSLRWLLTLPLQWGSPEIYELCYSVPFLLFIQLENLAQEMVPTFWVGLPIIITPYKGNLLQAFQEVNITR